MEHNIEHLSEKIKVHGEQASFEIPLISEKFFYEVSDQIDHCIMLFKLKGDYSLLFTPDVIKFTYNFAKGESSKIVKSTFTVALNTLSIIYRKGGKVNIKF